MSLAKLLAQHLKIAGELWVDHDTVHMYIDDDSESSVMDVLLELEVDLTTIADWQYADQDTLEITVE